jgi:2-polyprenyl-3-methyl-5-hydroxy-6-metoxy-1,4-benzoquinol methylase
MNDQPPRQQGPHYVANGRMLAEGAALAGDFARQILDTTAPFHALPAGDLDVLDVGCGYGHTAIELARRCRHVVGLEPSLPLLEYARGLLAESGLPNIEFRQGGVFDLAETSRYDLIVLDNVLEHLPDQSRALETLSAALRPGGLLYLLVPNKLWPVEVHYRLPLLSYLPLRLANRYLRWSGRGTDYTDASYAPTYFSLNKMLRARRALTFQYVLPAHLELAAAGRSIHYRLGTAMIRRFPWLWTVSKALLVIATKNSSPGDNPPPPPGNSRGEGKPR